MIKKIVLLPLLALFAIVACESDELQMEAQKPIDKVEFLQVKAKEFSKKYGVNITLNEDSLKNNIDNITVEEIEQEFISFSDFIENAVFCERNELADIKVPMVRNEPGTALDTMGMRHFSGEVLYRRNYYDGRKEYRLLIEGGWRHNFYSGYSCVIATFKLEENGNLLGETGLVEVPSSFSTLNGYLRFDARGQFTVVSGLYNYGFGINIYYHEHTGYSYDVY